MTIEEIKEYRITPSVLYKTLTTLGIVDALNDTITIDMLAKEIHDKYAVNFVCAMLDDIINSYKRKETMSEEERIELAELIVRKNGFLTIKDCKTFYEMLISCEIGTGRVGQEEYQLITIDKPSILAKLARYKAMRSEAAYNDYINKQNSTKKEEEPVEVDREKIDNIVNRILKRFSYNSSQKEK